MTEFPVSQSAGQGDAVIPVVHLHLPGSRMAYLYAYAVSVLPVLGNHPRKVTPHRHGTHLSEAQAVGPDPQPGGLKLQIQKRNTLQLALHTPLALHAVEHQILHPKFRLQTGKSTQIVGGNHLHPNFGLPAGMQPGILHREQAPLRILQYMGNLHPLSFQHGGHPQNRSLPLLLLLPEHQTRHRSAVSHGMPMGKTVGIGIPQ